MTLGLALGIAMLNARPREQPAPRIAEPDTLRFGVETQAFVDAERFFPFERYVLHGELQWLPFLLQLNNPEFLEDDKERCIALLSGMPEDANCPVEYSYLFNANQGGRVLGLQALVLSGADSMCRAYVECRLPGLASAQLGVPPNELAKHPASLMVVDKVRHATRRPSFEDEERQIAQLTLSLATPSPTDPMPLEAQRLNDFLRKRQVQLLDVLTHRKQQR